uniref:WW domain-containing protein n=1 Tax=Guillardia theta TaxID=55529 RepID=A0A7S4PFF9_GUITH|mmetsp:Transcript_49015/g.153910  ORF Transcript_49015/g.153910 Transcript_49015/m.153910 type:complete len:297 (+) Transcript_49015:279-1169(+)
MLANRSFTVALVLLSTLASCAVANDNNQTARPQPVEGSTEWWNMMKEEESRRTGKKVWAWDLETPRWHFLWYNESKYEGCWEEAMDLDHDPPEDPDIMNMEPVPRSAMPQWWTPTPCGTLNLSSPYTQHCFPPDGSSHHVCCVSIQLPATLHAEPIKDAAFVKLEDMIRAASHPSSYSWCTCNQFICEELLGGRVQWDQHALTNHRFVMEESIAGIDPTVQDLVFGGMDAVFELTNRPLPETDPYDTPMEEWAPRKMNLSTCVDTLDEKIYSNTAMCHIPFCPLSSWPVRSDESLE